MTFIEEYLNCLTEANAYTKRAAAGKLSDKDAKRIRDSGILRSRKTMEDGILKGAHAKAERAGVKLYTPKDKVMGSNILGAVRAKGMRMVDNITHPMHTISGKNRTNPDSGRAFASNAMLADHEANEAREFNKIIKRGKGTKKTVGPRFYSHASPKVIEDERKLGNVIKTLYSGKNEKRKKNDITAQARALSHYRTKSGEYDKTSNLSPQDKEFIDSPHTMTPWQRVKTTVQGVANNDAIKLSKTIPVGYRNSEDQLRAFNANKGRFFKHLKRVAF